MLKIFPVFPHITFLSEKFFLYNLFIICFHKLSAVARQMKTINYQLSSQKCLEEGWTLRAPSPLLDDLGDNVFEPEPLDPAMIAEGKVGPYTV